MAGLPSKVSEEVKSKYVSSIEFNSVRFPYHSKSPHFITREEFLRHVSVLTILNLFTHFKMHWAVKLNGDDNQ